MISRSTSMLALALMASALPSPSLGKPTPSAAGAAMAYLKTICGAKARPSGCQFSRLKLTVKTVPGPFTGQPRPEALLRVRDERLPQSENGGYTVLMAHIDGRWRQISKSDAPPDTRIMGRWTDAAGGTHLATCFAGTQQMITWDECRGVSFDAKTGETNQRRLYHVEQGPQGFDFTREGGVETGETASEWVATNHHGHPAFEFEVRKERIVWKAGKSTTEVLERRKRVVYFDGAKIHITP